ncbi:MAG TPA: 4Fe-4S dicluster domain-containing protein, partial [Phycisphaerales bacterium]|nr:4Fe-4S dicluster domain-containing protein [Phycisphaerales bacterium]
SAKNLSLPIAAGSEEAHGDCVDCHLCVTTCPTGIDIRDGLQMECIGCAQCIDACDEVMTRLKRPRGLIRYSSQAAMTGERKHILRPRVFIYATLLLALSTAFTLVLINRGPARITLLRGLGAPFVEMQQGEIGNQVRIHLINRQDNPRTFAIAAEGVAGARVQSEDFPLTLGPGESRTVPALLIVPAGEFTRGACNITVIFCSDPDFVQRSAYKLLGPGNTHGLTDESSRQSDQPTRENQS